jgi:hypothetical protein
MRPSERAAAAYRASQALDSRPAAVLAQAHQQLAVTLDAALFAYHQGAFDRMCRHNEEAARMLAALAAAVEGRSPEAGRLVGIYQRLQSALNRLLFDAGEIQTIRMGHNWARDMSRSFRSHLQ